MSSGLAPRHVANQLVRCFRAEADLLRVLGGWTARVAENDERLAFARDLGFRAEHGELLLRRLHRVRTTDRMIPPADEPWRRLIELIDDAPGTEEVVAAVYGVVGTALVEAYEQLVRDCDPLADELTIRLVTRAVLPDHRERNAWAERFLADRKVDEHWLGDVRQALDEAGGLVVRSAAVPPDRDETESGRGTGFWPLPRPNPRIIHLGSEYRICEPGERPSSCPAFEEFGPPDIEVQVIHHGLMPEISSLAVVGGMLHEVHDRPWDFYRDFATQCSDEVRHIGLLLRRLVELGARPDTLPFPTWTFYDAVEQLPVDDRTLVFNTVVEGNVVETLHDRVGALEAAGNPEAAYVMDWISADESLHLHNGMRWLWATGRSEAEVDALLNRGQALLGTVMKQKDVTNKVFDSASENLVGGDFYARRENPIAPIARALGGFTDEQIDRLIASAAGRTIRL